MSGGHLCEAEAPTEATAETSAPPGENEATPPTGHPERKSKFCDNEIPSPTVPPLRVRQAQNDPLSQNRHRRDLVGAETNAFGIRL